MGCISEEILLEFIERELPPGASALVEQHLSDCDPCRELLAAVADGAPEESLSTGTGPGSPEGGQRYQILKPIGAGGMGIIYAARDRQLHRMVALKILRPVVQGEAPETLGAHLLHEARAMARLAHPNVVAVYDVGVVDGLVCVAMEFVEGSSLADWVRKPHGWAEVLDVFLAAGRGLAAAHAAGIVHRDFKPDNVLIGRDGRVRVTDFGLSRLAATAAVAAPHDIPADVSSALASVSSGALVGSPAYMAPEQLRGQRADERSDVFSFCVALWEALFGERPFAGETIGELERTIGRGDLRQPRGDRRVPDWLVSALKRGLAASPGDRHPCMDELLSRLHEGPLARSRRRVLLAIPIVLLALLGVTVSMRAVVSPRERQDRAPSVAVLPFKNLNGDEQGEYLADGLTEDLILRLAKVPGLKVTGRASVFAFKGQQLDARSIGQQLGVEATLAGSVQRSGDRLRFVVRMMETGTGSELWSETIDGDSKELLSVYGQIGRAVARILKVKPVDEPATASSTPRLENLEAHSLVLKGRYLALQPLRLKDALAAFDRAIALDPTNAAAYAGASVVHARLGSWTADGKAPPREELSQAVRTARRALDLDPTEGLAHAVLGYLDNHFDWDVAGAEAEFKEALRLRPNDVDVLHWYAHFLASQGRFPEELAVTKLGLEIDPLHRYIGSHLAFHYLFTRHYSQAIQEAEKTLQLYPDEPFAMLYSAMAYELSGERQRAVAQLSRLETIRPRWLFARAQLGFTYARMGRSVEARQIFDELTRLGQRQYVPPPYFALILVGLGESENALGQLEKALADHSWWMTYLMIDPRFDALRDDPRFGAIVKRVGSERGRDAGARGSPR